MIPSPRKDAKGKVIGEFYPLQKAELIALRKAKLINNSAFVHLALRSENPYCDRPIEIIPKEFALRWQMPESSVYEAIAKLKESNAVNIKAGKIILEWVHSQQEDDSGNPESILRSQNQFWESRINSEIPENESLESLQNKGSESLQTITDFNKTITDLIPPTPQGDERGEDDENLEQPDQSIPESTTTLLIQPELFVQTDNPSCSSIVPAAFDKIEKLNKATDEQIKAWFLEVYQQEKPSNFTEHREINSTHLKKIKQLIKEHPQDAIAKFRDALIWVREQSDGWWRDKQISLANLMTNGKVLEYADKHTTAMKHDPAYRDRVEGRAPSKDLKRIMPDAIASQIEYEKAYESERRKQELIQVYDYREAHKKLRRF